MLSRASTIARTLARNQRAPTTQFNMGMNNIAVRSFATQGSKEMQRKFSSATVETPAQTIKRSASVALQPENANVSGGNSLNEDPNKTITYNGKAMFALFWINPVTIGYFTFLQYQAYFGAVDDNDVSNCQQGNPYIAQTREARRSSMKDFKEHVWGKEDTREYDDRTWRRYNYTNVQVPGTYAPGAEERAATMERRATAKAEAGITEVKRRRSSLYESERGGGVAQYQAAKQEQDAEKYSKEGEYYHR